MITAASEVGDHVIAHRQLEDSIDPDNITKWTLAVEAWEEDPTLPNPFKPAFSLPTQAATRHQLSIEEGIAIHTSMDFSLSAEVSPSVLIALGVDLESEQWVYFLFTLSAPHSLRATL